MNTSVILHISDIHHGSSSAHSRPEDLVHAVEGAIDSLKNDPRFRPSFLFCSGDLGSRGDADSIAQAKESLLKIADRLEIKRSRIVLCPGNHDVDRKATTAFAAAHPEIIKPDNPPKWNGEQFRAYLQVVQGIYGEFGASSVIRKPPGPDEVKSPSDIFSLHYYPDEHLVVYSVNSAVVESHRDIDHYGYVGKEQLDELDEHINDFKSKHHIKNMAAMRQVVLVHHPLFAPDDQDPSALRDPFFFMNWLWQHGVDLVLHGHQHYTRAVAIHGADAHNSERGFICAGAGSVGAKPKEMIDRRNSLNLIELESKGLGTRRITIRPGEFVRAKNNWNYNTGDERKYTLNVSGHEVNKLIGDFGLADGMRRLQKTQQKILEGEPVLIEGAEAAFATYQEALGKITDTGELRATSFLHSQFWGGPLNAEILRANSALKARAGKDKVKRIFLTRGDIKEYIKRVVQRAYNEKSAHNQVEWKRIEQSNQNLKYLAEEFDMKIIDCDRFRTVDDRFKPSRDELAIYDYAANGITRVDIFKLNDDGQVLSVLVLAGSALDNSIRRQYTEAFEEAWRADSAMDVRKYVDLVEDEMRRVGSAIEYTSEWLLKFDKLVRNRNRTLEDESQIVMSHVNDVLKRLGRNKFDSHLDVGVCTGRYIKLLKQKTRSQKSVDIDWDVMNFIKGRFPDMPFKLGDIRDPEVIADLGRDFGLVTCMLGTCCHFGIANEPRYLGRSGFAAGMSIMLEMLRPGGVLILSVWRTDVDNKLLSIYKDKEVERLKKGSPNETMMRAAAKAAGSSYEMSTLPSTAQLNLYAFERAAV